MNLITPQVGNQIREGSQQRERLVQSIRVVTAVDRRCQLAKRADSSHRNLGTHGSQMIVIKFQGNKPRNLLKKADQGLGQGLPRVQQRNLNQDLGHVLGQIRNLGTKSEARTVDQTCLETLP